MNTVSKISGQQSPVSRLLGGVIFSTEVYGRRKNKTGNTVFSVKEYSPTILNHMSYSIIKSKALLRYVTSIPPI